MYAGQMKGRHPSGSAMPFEQYPGGVPSVGAGPARNPRESGVPSARILGPTVYAPVPTPVTSSHFGGPTVAPPPVWTSPFGVAMAALGQTDPGTLTSAVAAAVEAETHVRKGVAAAKSWWPSTIDFVRGYFAVSHISVLRKLTALLCPPAGYYSGVWSLRDGRGRTTKRTLSIDESHKSGIFDTPPDATAASPGAAVSAGVRRSPGTPGSHNSMAYPKTAYPVDHLGLDLYIPLMAFVTYVLAFAFTKATLDDFHPELLSSMSTFALCITVSETLICYVVFFFLSMSLPLIDNLAILSQKFVCLVLIVLCRLIVSRNSILFWLVYFYSSVCAAHATLQSYRGAEFKNKREENYWTTYERAPRPAGLTYVILVVAIADTVLCYFLTP